ncbi:flagellar FlbD family protein [Pseudalkalibacillus caeni]|uniref:Flagellar protein FlbD n=1 Tax=Exobacillus caeni TaxID=2574798 RepID=A0A5R9F282_9BACL|nr:flagellar FlbD family protein [Pseudalkalibacillus caeni]TLS36639.1 hypothetical protein FCL54_14045 [Pseudalkalibacillus caeni]
MITLTKFNRETFTLNALYIEQVEETPDTLVTLLNGKKFLVREHAEEVNKKIKRFYREIQLLKEISKQNSD